MINKVRPDVLDALTGIKDGATTFIAGFGGAGSPVALIEGLCELGLTGLTVVSNNAGIGSDGLARLIETGAVAKIICSYPRSADSVAFDQRYDAGSIELELVPQGTLAERIRAGGAGIGGFFTPTTVGTVLAKGKEHREIAGVTQVLEYGLRADVALVSARLGDRWGNLTYRYVARNFAPAMASAATLTVAQVEEVVPLGSIDPHHVVTPAPFVDRVVQVDR
ncbi:3-oxoacid CoA-transferase subunit A [Rhodococcus sp. NPDC056960]|uniref:3-oxoacid CoA-transferase subunit A n=1 Tax=Rhodococcus TaxID=1827 RepID=UPI0036282CEB